MPATPTPDPVFSREPSHADGECVEDAPVVPRMLHFKVPYDGKLCWGDWAQKLFDPPPSRALVMAEHLNRATGHIHMQGTSSKSDRQIKRWREDLTHEHCLFKEFKRQQDNPDYKDYGRKRCRLIQTVDKRKPCNETGFQYMCKEFHAPIYQQGFTKEELLKLHADSNDYVTDKKMKINEMLDAVLAKDVNLKIQFTKLLTREECQLFMTKIRFQICELCRETDQKLPKRRYFSDDVINALYQRKDCPRGMRVFLASQI